MQMYAGLPIMTNKITAPEQRGIPHHLLGHIPVDKPTWVVGDFKRAADRIISEIRSRGNLPIVVGGTHYYINALLNADLLPCVDDARKDGASEVEPTEFPELDELPAEKLWERLQEVDPEMARRWHPKDRRKVKRSLVVYLTTGRKASELYDEQQLQKRVAEAPEASEASKTDEESRTSSGPWETLMFWVHSDREVLKRRLETRVDKMVTSGLIDEAREIYRYLQSERLAGREVDLSRGIWQSIGFKQFMDYLAATDPPSPDADDKDVEGLRATAIEAVKAATRRYASLQTRWIRNKLIPLVRCQHADAMDHLFVMDSTDLTTWQQQAVEPAAAITQQFMEGKDLPCPTELSETARAVLETPEQGVSGLNAVPCRRVCDACDVTVLYEHYWEVHIKSRRHHRMLKGRKKRALVPRDENLSLQILEDDGDTSGGTSPLLAHS